MPWSWNTTSLSMVCVLILLSSSLLFYFFSPFLFFRLDRWFGLCFFLWQKQTKLAQDENQLLENILRTLLQELVVGYSLVLVQDFNHAYGCTCALYFIHILLCIDKNLGFFIVFISFYEWVHLVVLEEDHDDILSIIISS